VSLRAVGLVAGAGAAALRLLLNTLLRRLGRCRRLLLLVPSTKITPVSAGRDLPLRPRRRGAVIATVKVAYANVIGERRVDRERLDARAPLFLPVSEEVEVDGRARRCSARVDSKRHVAFPEVAVAASVVDVSSAAAGVAVAVAAVRIGRPVTRAGAGVSDIDMVGPVRGAGCDVVPQLLLALVVVVMVRVRRREKLRHDLRLLVRRRSRVVRRAPVQQFGLRHPATTDRDAMVSTGRWWSFDLGRMQNPRLVGDIIRGSSEYLYGGCDKTISFWYSSGGY
jgi:hypothetical protein